MKNNTIFFLAFLFSCLAISCVKEVPPENPKDSADTTLVLDTFFYKGILSGEEYNKIFVDGAMVGYDTISHSNPEYVIMVITDNVDSVWFKNVTEDTIFNAVNLNSHRNPYFYGLYEFRNMSHPLHPVYYYYDLSSDSLRYHFNVMADINFAGALIE